MQKTKKTYEKPVLHAELFAPNDYVAACSTTEGYTTYNFVCNAGEGVTHQSGGGPGGGKTTKYVWYVYFEDGTVYAGKGGKFSAYGPCNATHEVNVKDGDELPFLKGYIDDYFTEEKENIAVWIWTDNGTNVHCMIPTNGTYTGPQKNLS